MNSNQMKISGVLLSLLMAACGQNTGSNYTVPEANKKKHAPTSSKDTGVLVSGLSNESLEELIISNPDIKVRTINPQHGLYEIHGLGIDELQSYSPTAVKNEFFQEFKPKNHPQGLQDLLPTEKEKMEVSTNADSSSNLQMETCVQSSLAPKVEMHLNAPKLAKETGVINIGEEIKVSMTATTTETSTMSDEPTLKYAWVISPPTGSTFGQLEVQSDNVVISPDAMGLWSFLAVVQDGEKRCGVQGGSLAVTANEPFNPTLTEQDKELTIKTEKEMDSFKHLNELLAKFVWSRATGKGKTIAVIDSGVNYNHYALKKNIAVNEKEIPGNGIDDDKNGLIDDYVGYDFVNIDPYPYDDQGHGSHVAGLAASSIFGMAKDAKIISVKALSPMGGDLGSIVGSILYSADRGADIINMSFGNYQGSHPYLELAIDYAEKKGALLIAAAGNGHPIFGIPVDTDKMAHYPSSLPNKNLISVAAKSSEGLLAPYSNYGVKSVDIVAPGGSAPKDDMISAFSANPSGAQLVGMSGTSMATPVVAGTAALVMELSPSMNAQEVKSLLMKSGTVVPALKDKIASGKYLSPLLAVSNAKLSYKRPVLQFASNP